MLERPEKNIPRKKYPMSLIKASIFRAKEIRNFKGTKNYQKWHTIETIQTFFL